MRHWLTAGLAAATFCCGLAADHAHAEQPRARIDADTPSLAPDLSAAQPEQQRLAPALRRFATDVESLQHFHDTPYGTAAEAAYRALYRAWQGELASLEFDTLGLEDRIDAALLHHELGYRLRELDRERARFDEAKSLLPEVHGLIDLIEARRLMQPQRGEDVAQVLDRAQRALADIEKQVSAGEAGKDVRPVVAYRAARILDEVAASLKAWRDFYAGYDPTLTWWIEQPYAALEKTLGSYAGTLRSRLAGADDDDTIVGDPIGREALLDALAYELIDYTPEELLRLADRELAWCHDELAKAAREMGFDDWRDALEAVKRWHPAPGEQPQLVRELAWEAIDYVEDNDLVTVPEIAKRDWRMNMLSPERQLQAPFFLGGTDVWVAFPTSSMAHDAKRMSLRGNNRHFSRAVVHHELIPGHHLQAYMNRRYQTHRQQFGTPFWTEGWALYWEFLLYERGFAKTPEDRIGMLFWRSHRAARIKFSLGFHLGRMTPQEAIDLLVDEVGHERDNAAAEVRRSFAGDYPPIYQAAYMLGGLQFRALHRELVGSGQMSDRAFHDAILQGGPMPVEMVRRRLTDDPPDSLELRARWRFYDLD